ncbi:MAG: hypothetical protein ABI550_03295 [Ignavibacteriaceae bacterium]
MKSIFLVFIIFFLSICLSSCTAEKDLGKKVYVYGYNFTKYTKQGFLFTPEPYPGDYESVGILEVEIYPEIKKAKEEGSNQYGTSNYGESAEWLYISIQTNEVLDSLFHLAKGMGADAVVRLDIEDVTQERSGFPLTLIPGKRASGFAIKRKLPFR